MASPDLPFIDVTDLRIGHYVHLELKWFEHPFAFNQFKIKDDEQLRIIRGLGLGRVRIDPARSDQPSVQPPPAAPPPQPAPNPLAETLAAKRALIEKIREQRATAKRIESAFVDTARTIHDLEKNLLTNPPQAVADAGRLVAEVADSILSAPELALHVMGDQSGGEELYFHSLNVTTLSLMMARDLKLPAELVPLLGLGALFHDIGTREIPDRIVRKSEPLTQPERRLYEQHCVYGADFAERLGLPPPVRAIIREHHELSDGSGYPQQLKGDAINFLARIVVIANHYDELCNPARLDDALTPHEALSQMFARQRAKFDPQFLQVFVRCLGVYPPGTVVQLSNGVIGMVATVNTAKPMRPTLVVYDAEVPREEAILVDLEREAEVNVARAIRPAQLPREIYNYLSPRKQVSYFFDAGTRERAAGPE